MNFSEVISRELKLLGFTHCFFVPGGGSMHLLNAIKNNFACIPVVHEIAAGLAAEAFNETSENEKAFALVTTGPGLTNITTAVAQAFVEYRPLLVLGGQVKSADLASNGLRQRGMQELPGAKITSAISCASYTLTEPIPMSKFREMVNLCENPTPGPVFIEICLDVQAKEVNFDEDSALKNNIHVKNKLLHDFMQEINSSLSKCKRPVLILGNNLKRLSVKESLLRLTKLEIPLMTTTSSIDRLPTEHELNFGFGGSWGGNYHSNLILSKSDLIIAIGTKLDLQFTGFNIHEYFNNTHIFHIFPDDAELRKNHIRNLSPFNIDPNKFLSFFLEEIITTKTRFINWVHECENIKQLIPQKMLAQSPGYVNPQELIHKVTSESKSNSIFSVASSGTASFTHALPALNVQIGNKVNVDPALASMGVGLSAAIGCAFANRGQIVLHFEGDGGFAQNIQELGTISNQNLPIKIFIFDNEGFASIRKTQKKYFDGSYIGCDSITGLGLPNWKKLFEAYDINCEILTDMTVLNSQESKSALNSQYPSAWIVKIDPDLDYYPTVSTKMDKSGGMTSEPLSKMIVNVPDPILKKIQSILNDREGCHFE